MAENQETYLHQPLSDERRIRVMILFGAKSRDEPILCDITETGLYFGIQYEALSYEWGTGEKKAISCGGKILQIPENCDLALRRLRRRKGWRILWIDSICIDQSSTPERNQQVKLMGDIYRYASSVLVWLGPGDRTTEIDMMDLRRIQWLTIVMVAPFRVLQIAFRWLLGRPQEGFAPPRFFSWACRLVMMGRAPFFHAIARRSYWTRVWTIQEVAFAMDCSVYCGDSKSVRLGTLQIASILGRDAEGYMLLKNTQVHFSHQEEPIAEQAEPRITDYLRMVCDKSTTEPRDKVYALRALLPASLGCMDVDYAKGVEEVFRDTTRLAVVTDNSLEVLYNNSCDPCYAKISSWVPDWNSDDRYVVNGFANMGTRGRCSKESDPIYNFSDDGLVIHLRGVIIDYIADDSLSDPLPNADSYAFTIGQPTTTSFRSFNDGIVLGIRHWISNIAAKGICKQPREAFHSLTRTLVPIPYTEAQSLGWLRAIATVDPDTKITDEELDEALLTPDAKIDAMIEAASPPGFILNNYPHLHDFHTDLLTSMDGLRFFATRQGRLGLSARRIECGDAIVLVSGLGLPLILRESGEYYKLVSPAAVQGVMDGEALKIAISCARFNYVNQSLRSIHKAMFW